MRENPISIAVVILNWNGATLLQQYLPILIQHSALPGVTLYVADNGSTDDSVEMLKENFPTVRRILFDHNAGFAGGYNKALQCIDAELFVILNSDVEVSTNWLEPVVSYMQSHPDVAACQPKIRSTAHREQFEYAGASGGFIDTLGYPFCRGRILSKVEEDVGQYNKVENIFWATGACMFIWASAFKSAGGFDETFFAHMEEIDLCWRLKSRGYRIVCVPQSVVYHVGGGTLQQEHPRKTFLNFRNNLLMLYKNLPPRKVVWVLFVRFWLDMVAALQLVVSGKPANGLAVIQACVQFYKLIPQYTEKRNDNVRLRTSGYWKEMFRGSILVQFYLKGTKKFSDLTFK